MNKKIQTFLTILTSIAVIFIGYYLNLEKPDVRYTLSEDIPVSITGEVSSKSIQQLEVKNIGNNQAEEISVKINKEVISYEVIKSSEADLPKVYKSRESFEFIYPNLPPEASFKLIINTIGEGVKNSDLKIQHLEGKATEALSEDDPEYLSLLSLIIIIIYLLMVIYNIKNFRIDSLKRTSEFNSKVILKRKKPIYINQKEWENIRESAIDSLFKNSALFNTTHIEDYLSYEYLTISKPNYLTENEWKLIIKKSSKKFEDNIMYIINRAYEADELLSILNTGKPVNFSLNKWKNLVNKINKQYLSLKKSRLLGSISTLQEELKEVKPDELSKKIWNSYRDFLKKEYINKLKTESLENISKYNINKILKRKKPECIGQEKWANIRESVIKYLFKNLELFNIEHIEDSLSYEYLTINKPKYLTENEWKLIIKKSSEEFEDRIMYKINHAYEIKELLSILNIGKPSNFSKSKWKELVDKINKQYLSLKKTKLYDSISSLQEKLKETKPEEISKDIWSSYRDFLKKEFFTKLNISLLSNDEPYAFLKDKDVSYLDQRDIDKLEKRAYGLEYNKLPSIYEEYSAQKFLDSDKPEWIKESDYKNLKKIAKKIIKLDKLIKENEIKTQLFNSLILDKEFPKEKPEEITEKEWDSLKTIYNKKIEISKLSKLKNKIEKQLRIINEFLNDPTVINRIEEYNNVFAEGNFNNLKKLYYKLTNNDII